MDIHVLVIEDDIAYGEMIREALRHYGYQVTLALSATSGLDVVRQQPIDIVISDLNMPGMNGIELAQRLVQMYLDIPIVLITGLHDLSLVKKALNMGVSDYLIKPIKIDEIPVVIERNLERKRLESHRIQENKAHILFKTIKALLRALDAKDPYTSGHSQRVVKLANKMADALNLTDDERFTLTLAAYLHDIGKIGIPDNILQKSASLADYELRRAKDHPIIGSQIIGEIEELADVASIVRHHHERYDGTGYPDGLKGEAIPFFARIIAIIDAYEALVSDRVYRKGISREEALREIERNAGTQFDPYLTKIFLNIMREEQTSVSTPPEDLNSDKTPAIETVPIHSPLPEEKAKNQSH